MTPALFIILVIGFLGFCTLAIRTEPFIKIAAIGYFILCFLSKDPIVSFSTYTHFIFYIYLFIALTKIKNWDRIYNIVLIFFLYNLVFMIMQYCRRDMLLNATGGITFFGLIGGRMMLESFLIVSFAILITKLKNRMLIFGLIFISAVVFMKFYHILNPWHHLMARVPAWQQTIQMANIHPFLGYGPGTFKTLAVIRSNEGHWAMAHNDFLQIAFEFGYIGLGIFLGFLYRIEQKLKGFALIGFWMILPRCS
jgi:O-antigen ligase